MFGRLFAFIVLIGFGFVVGVTQATSLFHVFPSLQHALTGTISAPANMSTPIVRCADEVQTQGWQVYRSDHLGFQFLYPPHFSVSANNESVTISSASATGSDADTILLERISGDYQSYINDSMQQGSWKIADRKTYALTTPFYSDDTTGQFTSQYLFIKNFPQHGQNGTYTMIRAIVRLGSGSTVQFDAARKAGIVDLESILTPPEQILSTFRFIEFDEGKDQG